MGNTVGMGGLSRQLDVLPRHDIHLRSVSNTAFNVCSSSTPLHIGEISWLQ